MKTKNISKFPVFYLSNDQYVRPKEYVPSPFRYPGGKYYALKHILPFITCVPHDEFREPFLGGGNVFFAKTKSKYNWLNDLEEDLIVTYNIMAEENLRKKLIKRISNEIATKERHAAVKELNPNTQFDIAFKTYYLNRTSYSGIIHKAAWGYKEGKSSPPQNWKNMIEPAGKKLEKVKLTSEDFKEIINAKAIGEQVFMYLDPPYFHADQKRAYTKSFVLKDHLRLATLLRKTKYLFCLSYDDCAEIRQLYSWANIYERSWLYNTANSNGKRIIGEELVITNYQIADLFSID